MRRSITGIDHAIVLVRNLDAARDGYERLGFTVAPRGLHPPEHGTANHTVMLEREYLELLGVMTPTPGNAHWQSALARGDGLSALALQTPSADAVVAEMAGAGVALDPPEDFARQVVLPDRTRTQAAFRTAHFPKGVAPGFHLFCCEHRTRHVTWRPELLRHPNGAVALDEVLATSDAPAAAAAALGTLFSTTPVSERDGSCLVDTGNSTIRFATACSLAERFAPIGLSQLRAAALVGLTLRTSSIAAAEAALVRSGTRHAKVTGGIAVAPEDACGALLVFREG
ncbi:MAG TPA: VOC family protein [Caldimonas sp.]|jgi:catechol 2,3-dioxygenase-like lactoylglutathione lyase family enzyme|nr:VOC family protein [Caldimonas sp.]HEX4235642.1 VOC family protein [Caldimonas sp.]